MAAPTKLFLEKNDIDDRYKVVDENGFPFGDGKMPDEAVKSARIVTNAPIHFGSGIALADTTDALNKDELIEALAELAGMRVRCVYDNEFKIAGYTLELVE